MVAVSLVLAAFLHQLSGQSVVLMSDNTTFVAYLQHQGGTVSRVLCRMATEVVLWMERHSVSLTVRYILGKKNALADQLSRPNRVLPTELSPLRSSPSQPLCQPAPMPGFLCVYLRLQTQWFGSRTSFRLQHPWDHLSAYAFPLFALLRQVLSRVLLSLVLVVPLWLQKACWPVVSVGRRTTRTSTGVELTGAAPMCRSSIEV